MALLPASAGWSLLLIAVFAIDGSAPSSKPPLESAVQISGRVLDPDGKPVAGARLYYPRWPKKVAPFSDYSEIDYQQPATTGSDGRFDFRLPRSDIPSERTSFLIAGAEGYGPDGIPLPKEGPPGEITLRLVKDLPIEGTVVSTEGRPLPGIEVVVMGAMIPAEQGLDGFLENWKQNWALFRGMKWQLGLPGKKMSHSVTTDHNGRFKITGAGKERLVSLVIKGPAVAQATVYVVTRERFDPVPYNHAAQNGLQGAGDPPPVLYGPKFVHVAGPGRTIAGVVRESGGGKPLEGILIATSEGFGNWFRAFSDSQGKYRLSGLPRQKGYQLMAIPDPDSTLLRGDVPVAATPGSEPIKFDIEIRRGISVTGRLVDKRTGQGVRGWVQFNSGGLLEQAPSRNQTDASTDDAGFFRIHVFPGKGYIWGAANTVPRGTDGKDVNLYRRFRRAPDDRLGLSVNFYEEVNFPPGTGSLTRDFFLDPGKTVRVHVQDPDGKPLSGVMVVNLIDALGYNEVTFAEPDCPVYALDPSTPRRVLFYHAGRDLIGSLLLRGDEKDRPVARPLPAGTLTLRVLDGEGQPLVNAAVYPRFQDQSFDTSYYRALEKTQSFHTDANGRIRLRGIPPNLDLKTFDFQKGRETLTAGPWQKPVRLALGQTLDLGDIVAKGR